MKKFILMASICLGICLAPGCEYKKYPEGPLTTVYLPQDRIVNTWRWALALESGGNTTGILNDSTIQFRDDNMVLICPKDGEGECREGTWALVTRNTKLNIIFGTTAQAFDIQRLTRSQAYLMSAETDSDTYWELEAL